MTMVLLNLLHNLLNISVVASNTLLFVTFKLVGVLFQSTFKFGVCAVGSMLVVISEGAHVLVVQVHEHLDPLFLSLHQLTVDLLSDMGEFLFDLTNSSSSVFLCKKMSYNLSSLFCNKNFYISYRCNASKILYIYLENNSYFLKYFVIILIQIFKKLIN